MNKEQLILLAATARAYASLLNPSGKARADILAAVQAALAQAKP